MVLYHPPIVLYRDLFLYVEQSHSAVSTRYVILHHVQRDGEHWDLMLEYAGTLMTWQLSREPVDASSFPQPARRIGDHRIAYLDYEGTVSGDRGHVKRIDRGPLSLVQNDSDQVVFTALGRRLNGRFRLTRQADDEWLLQTDDPRS